MAKQENFNDLIHSIQEAFLQANQMAENQHLTMLQNYFDANRNPICIDINYPHFTEKGEVKYNRVSIPKLCLVPISSLKLSEIEVDFKVKLYGKIKLSESKSKEDDPDMLISTFCDKKPEPVALGYIPNGARHGKGGDSYANIRLKFTAEDAPEGLMRISDELIKVL